MGRKKILLLAVSILVLCFLVLIFDTFTNSEETMQKVQSKTIRLESPAWQDGGPIPPKFTCDGSETIPPLTILGVPAEAKSLVLIMDDPDAPIGTWDHWIVFNIDPGLKEIREGQEPSGSKGQNSWGQVGYGGPCPGRGSHRYYFKLYALDTKLELPDNTSKKEIIEAMTGHVLDQTAFLGTYERQTSE